VPGRVRTRAASTSTATSRWGGDAADDRGIPTTRGPDRGPSPRRAPHAPSFASAAQISPSGTTSTWRWWSGRRDTCGFSVATRAWWASRSGGSIDFPGPPRDGRIVGSRATPRSWSSCLRERSRGPPRNDTHAPCSEWRACGGGAPGVALPVHRAAGVTQYALRACVRASGAPRRCESAWRRPGRRRVFVRPGCENRRSRRLPGCGAGARTHRPLCQSAPA
jgi:hypothetical protein